MIHEILSNILTFAFIFGFLSVVALCGLFCPRCRDDDSNKMKVSQSLTNNKKKSDSLVQLTNKEIGPEKFPVDFPLEMRDFSKSCHII